MFELKVEIKIKLIKMDNSITFQGPFKRVCADRPQDYSYYNKYDVAWSKMDSYQI